MRQFNLLYLISLALISVLFLSACVDNQDSEAHEDNQVSHLDLQKVDQTGLSLSREHSQSMATKTPADSSPSSKTSQSISEGPERAKIPFSKSSSPKSQTTPITTTLTPTNGLLTDHIGQDSNEEGNKKSNEEEDEDEEENEEEDEDEIRKAPNLPSGNTVNFQASLDINGESSFPFLATPDSVILVNTKTEGELELSVEVEDMRTRQKIEIFAQMDKQDTVVYKIPDDAGPLYRVLIKPIGASQGDYSGFFISSGSVAFSLLPIYGITARLAEESTLAYLYTGKAEPAVQFNLLPRPEDDLNLVVRIYKLNDLQTLLFEEKPNGVDKEVEFLFTPPEQEFGTYLVVVEEVSGKAGKFKMIIKGGEQSEVEDDLMSQIQAFF